MEKLNDGSGKLTDSYNKIERWNPEVIREISEYYYKILKLLALSFLTRGYEQDPEELLRSAIFKEEYRQMVIVKDIDIYSMCEHHMLPFFGKAHVAYIPDGTITGLSKIARVVETYAARLQVQERLTTQIRNCIQDNLKPLGVAVVIEAQHMCMQIRGVQKQNSVTTTSAFTGCFHSNLNTREEFIHLIGSRLH
jgi:GTP cyclohydrolase I